jgi:hypothetical protein
MAEVLESRFDCDCILNPSPDPKRQGKTGLYAFTRIVEGVQREAIVPFENLSDPVMPSELEYVCRRLGIDNPRDVSHSH